MLIKLPVDYQASCVSARSGNHEIKWFGLEIETEIAEIENGEAPIAARWEIDGGRIVGQTRWYQDKHWCRLQWPWNRNRPDGVDREAPVSAEEFAWLCDVGGLDTGPIKKLVKISGGSMFRSGRVKQHRPRDWIVGEDRTAEKISEAVRSTMDDYALIDGAVWHVCGEPMLKLDRHDGIGITTSDQPSDDLGRSVEDLYRLDMANDALGAFEDMYPGRPVPVVHVDVMIPEAIRYPADGMALLSSAKALLAYCKDRSMSYLTADDLIATGCLMKAIDAADAGTGAGLDELAIRMEEVLALEDHMPTFSSRFMKAVDRWRSRWIDIEEEIGFQSARP